MISAGRTFAARRWTIHTGPGVETAIPSLLSISAHAATREAFDANGKCRIAFFLSVSFAAGINSVSLIQ